MNDVRTDEQREVFDQWIKDLEETRNVRNDAKGVYFNAKISMISQRHELFTKVLIPVIAAIIATPYFLQIAHNEHYYFIGVAVLLSLVVYILLLMREAFDMEFEGLQRDEDRMVEVLQKKIALTERYLKEEEFSYENAEKLHFDIQNSPETSNLIETNENMNRARSNRENLPKDYTGELIMFAFLSGIFWILGSIFPMYFSPVVWVLGEIMILIFTSINVALFVSKIFSGVQNYVRRTLK